MITSADWLSVLCCCRAMPSLAFVCIHHILARPGLLRDFLLSLLFHQTCHFQSLLLCSVLPIFFFGTMTSADFCRFSCVLRHRLSFFFFDIPTDLPRYSHHLSLHIPASFTLDSLWQPGFCLVLQTHPTIVSLHEIRVPQARVLPPASFRFHLAMDTLALSYWLLIAFTIRDFHP